MKYIDPDGRVVVRQLSLESMSKHIGKLPNSGEKVSKYGCVVATISNMFNALSNSVDSSISSIIGHAANTDEDSKNDFFDSKGNLFLDITATAFGFKYGEKLASNTDLVEAFNELSDSTTNFAVGATVKWGESSDGHTVGVNGMAEFNGKAYIEVAPSSDNDVKGGTNRNNWIKENGKLYVPVSDVIKLRYIWEDE